MESVIEILAKTSGGDLLQWIAVGRTDDAHINLFGDRGTNLLETTRLQKAQQFALQLKLHLTDFIHEQGSTIRASSSANPLTDGTGIGTFDMAKDLTLHQVFGDRGTIESNQLLPLAAAEPMNGFGAQLLARSTLTGNKNGRPGWCRRLYGAIDRLHGHAGSDKAFKLFTRKNRLVAADQCIEATMLDGVAQRDTKPLCLNGFDNIIVGPQTHGIHRHIQRAVSRHHNDADAQSRLLQNAQDLHARHIRKVKIEKQNIRLQ